MKLVTFVWSRTIELPDNFNPENRLEFIEAEMKAHAELIDEEGEITDIQEMEN